MAPLVSVLNYNGKLHTSIKFPSLISDETSMPPHIKGLHEYKNFKLSAVNINGYFNGTPIQKVMDKGELMKSKYRAAHLGDAFRMVLLNRHGGTYLDFDMLIRKSLHWLPYNSACSQATWRDLVNGACNLDPCLSV